MALQLSTGIPGARSHPSRLRIALAAVVAAGLGLPTALPAGAADPDTRRSRILKEISASEAALADLSQEARQALIALRRTEAAIPAAESALAKAQARVAAAVARKKELDQALTLAKADEVRAVAELAEIRRRIDIGEGHRNDMARIAYEGGADQDFALLLAGGSAREISEKIYFVEKANDRQNAALDELSTARVQAQAAVVRLAETRRRIAGLNEEARLNVIEAEAAQQAGRQAKDKLVALRAVHQRQVADVDSRRAKEKARLDSLQKESDRLTALLLARARASKASKKSRDARAGGGRAGGSGRLAYPVNAPIGSAFGMRFHPILRYARLHSGLDFSAGCGSPVYAAGDGTVIRAGWAGGYGNQVVVAHSGSLATTYNHLSSIRRRSGPVKRGDLIAYSGTTGLSTGCHLHFEVRVNGSPVNPRGYL